MRTVNINFNPDAVLAHGVPAPELRSLLGYFVTWGCRTYPTTVELYRDGPTDIFAVYFRENGVRLLTMAGIWDDASQKYTTHS
jgi:hypothetical protein